MISENIVCGDMEILIECIAVDGIFDFLVLSSLNNSP